MRAVHCVELGRALQTLDLEITMLDVHARCGTRLLA